MVCVRQGLVLLVVSAAVPDLTPPNQQTAATAGQAAALWSSLYLIALGTGGIKVGRYLFVSIIFLTKSCAHIVCTYEHTAKTEQAVLQSSPVLH